MSDVRQMGDTDRLPWLEPYRDRPRERAAPVPVAVARDSKAASAGHYVRVPMWLLLALGAVVLGVAGYFIGRSANPQSGQSVTTELPQATLPYHSLDELANEQAPPPPPVVDEADPPAATVAAPVAKAPAPVVKKAAPKKAVSRSRTPKATRQPPVSAPVATPPPAPVQRPRFVMRYSPAPAAGRPGQVIEIGRYTNPRIADAMYRRAVWRYPYLGRLSKVVTPTATAGRRPVYALRLGTGSRSHARTLCRNLVSIGYPCAVV
ncbi:hypothetical protein H9L12_08880 [Sphingomonas rhizophila]|uniref:SPOR domain-containing protein n=1 Tax=Sphingomonas rhizophila TaxID=2071607 RepID=A0A7G9S9B1_9SPHN|nr:hypothetical protein [Sphingomonas rhizophila]QNN64436.1 hypothetical protein H9L12_08880 [Sphingomonas rhizophila]